MKKILLYLFMLLVWGINSGYSRGVAAGTRITNWATISYTTGIFTKHATNYISTNVMAVYGVSEVGGITNGYTYAGGTVDFTYYITNNGNTDMRVNIILSNFSMNGGYSGSAWIASYSTNSSFSSVTSITGTAQIAKTNTYSIGVNEIFPFYLRIFTAADAVSSDWGYMPVLVSVSNKGNYIVHYTNDYGEYYGGFTNRIIYPRVTIQAPFITLRKTLSVSNMPVYLASGGLTNIPVPDAVITYTNYYDNDGNVSATNLVIIDRIPSHTDFIIGSVMYSNYTGGTLTVRYYDSNNNLYIPTGASGDTDSNIRRIEFSFENAQAIGSDDNSEGTDVYGTADGEFPDADAGWVAYKVIVHRRE